VGPHRACGGGVVEHLRAGPTPQPPRRLKEWKQNVERMVNQQKGRKFEPPDCAKLYGMF
jgi:hypothetical protein